MFSSQAVANYLLDLAKADGDSLTHMQLQKLVYIAHGWHLAVTGKPLLIDTVEAWQYGPVIRSLYQDLKHVGHDPVSERLSDPKQVEFVPANPNFPQETREVMDRVWAKYRHLTGIQLSSMTHQPNTPWYEVAGKRSAEEFNKSLYIPIPNESIRRHYLSLAKAGRNSGRG